MTAELDLLRAWPDLRAASVKRIHQGNNNQTWRVGSPQGEFILQILLNATDRGDLTARHRLLAMVQDQDPGFAVPTPVPTSDGSTIVALDGESPRLGVLTRVIPGAHPVEDDPDHLTATATALGDLHRALARIPAPERFTGGLRTDSFAPKAARFGGPAAMIEALGLPAALTGDLVRVFAELAATMETMASTRPAQIVHGDYYPSNVLIAGGKVSGILDFEFVSLGARAYDVALGLWVFVLWHADDAPAWQRAKVFLDSYAATVSLAPHEWRHLADFIVIQEAHAMLHWCERFIGGLADRAEMKIRGARLIEIDRWVARNRQKLDDLVAAIG